MKLYTILLTTLIFTSFSIASFAAEPSFSLSPGSGRVKSKSTFITDLLIDSNGKEVNFARAVISFDPEYVQVVKAERNASLFCAYPEDEQSIDNEQGLLMISGFCQSGSGTPYTTSDEADVLARITFKSLQSGNISLKWEYSGEDELFKTVIMKDGSPPQNILLLKPRDASFTAVASLSNNPVSPVPTPATGYSLSFGLVASGVALTTLGFVYVKWSDKGYKSKLRTVVMYGNKN